MRAGLDRLQRLVARSPVLTGLALRARNQLNAVIGYRLGETSDALRNGEFLLLDRLAPLCSRFVDVGAHRGEWSARFLARADASGILFEPNPACLPALRERFAGARVEIVPMAVGDRGGEVEFRLDPGGGELSSAVETAERSEPGLTTERVRATTLDAFLESEAVVDFLKIDAEGYDFRVLCGARRLLASGRIKFLQFEYNSLWLGAGSSLVQALRLLGTNGYRHFLVRSDGLYDFDYERWGDFFRYSNFFACRPDLVEHARAIHRGAV